MSEERRILVVDDHLEMARVISDRLTDAGHEVQVAGSGAEAIAIAERYLPDLIITDLRMDEVDGFDVLGAARAIDPELPVIVMTAFGTIDTAIEAIKRGAYHYVTKPLRLDELLVYVDRALSERALRGENRSLRRLADERSGMAGMIGRSPRMREVFDLCERVAMSTAPVLIRGESGTGKELVARAIHMHGPRRDAAFVPVNCTALPDHLLESELFGHVRGAFTGATAARRGLFVEADGGTLLLDEIGDMDTQLQAKVLRVVEDGEVRPVGSDVSQRVDVRLIAATNQNLEQMILEGRFREDLFYRLNVVPIHIPPLRERPEDIPALVDLFLERAIRRNPHSPVRELSPELLVALGRRPWAGNVRELENLIERLVVVSPRPSVGLDDLERLAPGGADTSVARAWQEMLPLRQVEADYIDWVIERCGGNKTRAAEVLGVDVSTIHRRKRSSQ